MVKVKKATFQESMIFLKPVLRELGRLAIHYDVNEAKRKIVIRIPRFIPEKE